MKNLEKQIRLKLVEYLLGERDLSQLRAWIGPVTWDIDNSTDEDTKRQSTKPHFFWTSGPMAIGQRMVSGKRYPS